MRSILILSLLLFGLAGCDTGLKQMGPTEYGVFFRKLPPSLGGGVSNKVVHPGQMSIVWPWESVYYFDTSVQDISWGVTAASLPARSEKETVGQHLRSGYVPTRAYDGNEVAIAITVRYKITTDESKLVEMVERVAVNDEEVYQLVDAVARADIRTYMNFKTSDFLSKKARYDAVEKVQESMSKRLNPLGIEIVGVILNDFRFERRLADGSVDASYQERLKDIQKLREDREREYSRIQTVKAQKQQEYNQRQGEVNKTIAAAEGYRDQARFRGDSYYEAHVNQAKGIRAKGEGEVKGLVEQINALSGPGGAEILKLELARSLLANDPKFVVVDQGNSQALEVKRLDTNQLLSQIGVVEGLHSDSSKAPQIRTTREIEEKMTKKTN